MFKLQFHIPNLIGNTFSSGTRQGKRIEEAVNGVMFLTVNLFSLEILGINDHCLKKFKINFHCLV